MKIVRIWDFSGLYFPAFGLNTERYGVSRRMQSECGKMRTKETPIMETFHTVVEKSASAFGISIKSTHEFEWYLQSVLLKWTRRTCKMIKKILVFFLKCGRKINTCGRAAFFRSFTGYNNFSKVSLHFKRMISSSRKVLRTYSQICIFLRDAVL